MKDKIIKIAENLIEVRKLKEELNNKEYWIKKAQEEAGFVPAEGDWIHVDVTLFKIEVGVHHKEYGSAIYWMNGIWTNNPFDSSYPLHEKMLMEI